MWIACLCGGIHGREVCKQREASVDERRAETLLGPGDAGGAPRCGVGAPSMTVPTKSENACGFGVEDAGGHRVGQSVAETSAEEKEKRKQA